MNTFKLITAVFLVSINGEINGQQCKIPNGGAGTCVPIKTCTPILNYSKKPDKTHADVQFLQQSSCGYGFKPKVCCPHKTEWQTFAPGVPVQFPTQVSSQYNKKEEIPNVNLLTIPSVDNPDPLDYRIFPESNCPDSLKTPKYGSDCCGVDASSADKIVGGTEAAVDQYPWLALLEYADKEIRCGGTLISSRYVLTAAHCVEQTRYGPAVRVRLAEYNMTSYPTDYVEGNGGGFDNVTVVEITVERQIRHPQYKATPGSAIHDIGLAKMSRNAPFTDFIRPVCLPTYDATVNPEEGILFTVAGWGSNGYTFNAIKQQLKVPFSDKEKCQKAYPNGLIDTQFCAGGEKNKDTCNGDSGGPLVYEDESKGVTIIVGVVSYGYIACGTENAPGVYTNVYKYLDWIDKETI